MIRNAKLKEIPKIKKFVDSFEEMDTDKSTFPVIFYKRILKRGILLLAEEKEKIVGVCFGTYNKLENWSDLLGIVVHPKFQKQGIGKDLVGNFEEKLKKEGIKTIDVYSHSTKAQFFYSSGFIKGNIYISFRKKIE